MQLWVGLGNPGPQYAMHRHNVGFMALDVIAEMHAFGPVQKKFQGWLQEGRIAGIRVLLFKPATFMNESGRAVSEALRFYKLEMDALTERVTGHVLGNYAKAEIDDLTDMLAAIGAEAEWLAQGEDARFMSDVALRQQPG